MTTPDPAPDLAADAERALADYQARVAQIAQRAEAARERLGTQSTSVTSDDGAVTLSVNAAGVLTAISFGSAAEQLALADLASLIMRTQQAAQVRAARATEQIMVGVVGASSEAMNFVRSQLRVLNEAEPSLASSAQRPDYNPDYSGDEN